ncbi:unnamed protein product [Pleuronectes platessa]|uniref:Uncharacterized protein n=1 Tax=Pleuronectes platessa TaxID=8262 RepID=A0A9N7W0F6_PLEPL|nr:unnamed protein product [Pleuronectes platessa]
MCKTPPERRVFKAAPEQRFPARRGILVPAGGRSFLMSQEISGSARLLRAAQWEETVDARSPNFAFLSLMNVGPMGPALARGAPTPLAPYTHGKDHHHLSIALTPLRRPGSATQEPASEGLHVQELRLLRTWSRNSSFIRPELGAREWEGRKDDKERRELWGSDAAEDVRTRRAFFMRQGSTVRNGRVVRNWRQISLHFALGF